MKNHENFPLNLPSIIDVSMNFSPIDDEFVLAPPAPERSWVCEHGLDGVSHWGFNLGNWKANQTPTTWGFGDSMDLGIVTLAFPPSIPQVG